MQGAIWSVAVAGLGIVASVVAAIIVNVLTDVIGENSDNVTRRIREFGLRFVPEDDRDLERQVIESDVASQAAKPWTAILHSIQFTLGTVWAACQRRATTLCATSAGQLVSLKKRIDYAATVVVLGVLSSVLSVAAAVLSVAAGVLSGVLSGDLSVAVLSVAVLSVAVLSAVLSVAVVGLVAPVIDRAVITSGSRRRRGWGRRRGGW